MEPVNSKISLRPVRAGFLVSPTDRAMLSRVMRLATCMWGGLMCPLLPVMQRLPRAWQDKPFKRSPDEVMRGYLEFFEPDVLVQTAAGQFDQLGIREDRSFGKRRFENLDAVIRKDHGLEADLDVGLNMYYRYRHLFKDEFQFAKRNKPQIFQFSEGSKLQSAFFEAAFGCFPKGDTLHYLPGVYQGSFGAKEAPPSSETWSKIIKDGAGYPLYYTVRDMDLQVGERSSPSIFVFDPLNPTDVIDFWNFRLFTRDVVPVNSHWLTESRALIAEFIRSQYRLLPTNPNGVMIHTALHVARSLDAETTHAALDLSKFELPSGSYSIQGWYPDIWRARDDEDRVSRPIASVLSVKERDVQLVPNGKDSISLQYPVLSPDFNAGRMGNGPKWVNTVQVRQYNAKPEIALALPSAGFDAKPYYPVVGPEQFVSREGYVTFHHYDHDNSYLTLPTPKQAIISWLDADGIKAEPSDAGRVAEQVIASVGGLRGSHVFRDRAVIALLDKMARSRKEWVDGSSEEFEGRAAPVQTWQKTLKPIQNKMFGRWWTLESFVEHNILQLGLAVRCPLCAQKNWYSLDEVGSEVRCTRCTKPFPYPQGQANSTPWEYRAIGPFATPHYARGGYTVALALRFLEDGILSMNDFTYSTGIELTRDGKTVETDFFAWQNKQGFGRAPSNPITLVGECKSLGTEAFKKKDIDNLKQLAEWLPGAYLVAATLKDEFSAEEIKRLRTLARWGWEQKRPSPLILLTGTELFGDSSVSNSWKEAGGRLAEIGQRHNHIFNFPDLAAATQELHLHLETQAVGDMRYGRRRRARVRAKAVAETREK